MIAFENSGCYDGEWTAVELNETSAAHVSSSECAVLLGKILPPGQVQASRYTGIVIQFAFLLISLYKFKPVYKKLVDSVPAQAYLIISMYNFSALISRIDPSAAEGLLPNGLRFLLKWISVTCLFSLLVLAVWGIMLSVFRELNRVKESWLKARNVQILFVFIACLSFVSSFPSRNNNVIAVQRIGLVLQTFALGSLGLFNGFRLHSLLLQQLKAHGPEYKRALLKIRFLIAAIFIAVSTSMYFDIQRVIENFNNDGDLERKRLYTAQELDERFWKSTIYSFFVTFVVNVLALVLFRRSGASPKNTGNKPRQGSSSSPPIGENPAAYPQPTTEAVTPV